MQRQLQIDQAEVLAAAAAERGAEPVGDAALKAELAALKRDYAALPATAAEVDDRLQTTIGRLEIVLEN